MTITPPPSPAAATDETTFVAELRRLKTWSGLSFRQLERNATDSGDVLPYSTAATMLNKNRLPRAEVVAAFVRACGVADLRPWLLARTRIADGTAAVQAPAPLPASPRGRLSGWRRAVVAAAALVVTFTAGTALDTVAASEEDIDVEVVSP
ncbi:helix-turn-helix domain-containing protein [Actinophytocola algeriensis]|uniref:Helix-turn-helix protein n=1 Tax=Actinophytocola algeriensis TaxID=1768010 RepID=A0A7W7QFZ3_9PSEU|nr:hypothetical protein [Actinophytocola algeriensis]MBB4912850.1 hypothetical protein [Actinophytocola algeriensis]MBE1474116.1 hypothetical protein [Actinophytocola algeriensis]